MTFIDSFRHKAQLHVYIDIDPKHVGLNSQLMHYVVAQVLILSSKKINAALHISKDEKGRVIHISQIRLKG